ncbi:MAG TPA: FAD-binding oxidoreductase [Candidatus Angelobacter sp.]|nr:FAD-binding oxidoreductase [Candidatus Angelobacter sp.]
MTTCDFLVIGAGISGAAAAYELAPHGKVIVLEAEPAPGYHSTGRSAALYTKNFGSPTVRAFNGASLPFLSAPPPGFAEHPLLTPRGALTIGRADQQREIEEHVALGAADGSIIELSQAEALRRAPHLKPEAVAFAAYEDGVMDMDVAAIHQGFLRGLKARGGTVACDAGVTALDRRNGAWQAETPAGAFTAPIVINAAGAWADNVAALAGAKPVGLVPKRRTAIIVELPNGTDTRGWPAVDEAGYGCYCKPETGRVMASPADATPVEPCDVQPEDLDVAIIADWLERSTLIPVRRIARRWAGLRCFVADDGPVCGFDDEADGFFWLCGQGGYGIMMASSLGRATASLIERGELPADIAATGVAPSDIGPERTRRA